MNKPKFSLHKAVKAVEISSRIEGQKIPKRKSPHLTRDKNKIKN